jgi:hypothetical protein
LFPPRFNPALPKTDWLSVEKEQGSQSKFMTDHFSNSKRHKHEEKLNGGKGTSTTIKHA